MDLYHWFDKPSKRKPELKEYYHFCDTDYSEIIKFVSTCCLCLKMCVNYELKKYEELKSYFLSEARIYQLDDAQEHFMNKLASRFIKPEVIQKLKTEGKIFY